MKKSIKKAALTTLSAVAILSAVPSVFCAPYGKNQNVNERGHIDSFNIMVVGKYLSSVEDFRNLSRLKKYQNLLSKYRYNPVEINSREQLALFPNIETCRIGKFEKDFITTFPNEKIKTMIYLPGSFHPLQFEEVLRNNGITYCGGKYTGIWEREVKINDGNPMKGCCVIFTKGDKKIIFEFDPCIDGNLVETMVYNGLLALCKVNEAMISLSGEISVPGDRGIGLSAFFGCSCLKSVKILDGVKSIGYRGFWYCSDLEKISIPTSVESIGDEAFDGCNSLNHIEFNGNVYDSVDSFMQAFNAYKASQKQ